MTVEESLVTIDEVPKAAKSPNVTAPGADRITNKTLKQAVKTTPSMVARVNPANLNEGSQCGNSDVCVGPKAGYLSLEYNIPG